MKQVFIHFPELLGSDSFTPTDARLSVHNLMLEAHAIANDKRFVQPNITKAAIWLGDIRDGSIIKEFPIERTLYRYAVYCELSKKLSETVIPISPDEASKYFPPYQKYQQIICP